MNTLIRKNPPLIKYHNSRLHYITSCKINYNNLPIGIVKGKSNDFSLYAKTKQNCEKEVKKLNSNRLNSLKLFNFSDIELTVKEGTCEPYFVL